MKIRKKINNQITSINSETVKVLFTLIGVQRDTFGEIEYLTFADIAKNKIVFFLKNNVHNLKEADTEIIEVELLEEIYDKARGFIFDSKDIISVQKLNAKELSLEVLNILSMIRDREVTSDVTRTSEKIFGKMLLKKRGETPKGKIRYENSDGHFVDLVPRREYFNKPELTDAEFVEALVEIAKYNLSLLESKLRFPNNFYYTFNPSCIKRSIHLETLNTDTGNHYFDILRSHEYGDDSVFMSIEELTEAIKVRELQLELTQIQNRQRNEESKDEELEFNIPVSSTKTSSSIETQETTSIENQLSKRQIAQQARRERERAIKGSQAPKVLVEKEVYDRLVEAYEKMENLNLQLNNSNVYNQELLEKYNLLLAEFLRLKEEYEKLSERIRTATAILNNDLNKLQQR